MDLYCKHLAAKELLFFEEHFVVQTSFERPMLMKIIQALYKEEKLEVMQLVSLWVFLNRKDVVTTV